MQHAMAFQPRPQPTRLHIPPHLASQQFDAPPMFSPGLPTAIHQGYPNYAHSAMQTPMQQTFFPGPPQAPGRQQMHRAHASMAQLAAAGILPPAGMPLTPGGIPITPLGQGFPGAGAPLFPSGPGGFVPKSRRTMSIGGPPKAVLGGPGKQQVVVPVAPAPPPVKTKKVPLNLPKETIPGQDGEPSTRPEWARNPLVSPPEQPEVHPPEITTAEEPGDDTWRYSLPDTVEVYLPGRKAWEKIKHEAIEEKLEKLGVERGSGSNIPHIHAPHARAASISSPADPALLLFRLNKLHASQVGSPSTSLTTSPHPPHSLSISPHHGMPPRFQGGRHGYSMSLAQPPTHSPASAFNPFGPHATLGSDQVLPAPEMASSLPEVMHAPQGRVPLVAATLAPPMTSRPASRPDFARGFGLDIPEEDEEAEMDSEAGMQDAPSAQLISQLREDVDVTGEDSPDVDNGLTDVQEENEDRDGSTTAPQSRVHSRHVSRLSAALSLREVGGLAGALMRIPRSPDGEVEVDNLDEDDAVEEWTGSEAELRGDGESSADESIGEWSNPSDEERARQQRVHRRALRRARQETPRRLPNFPRPPENALSFGSMSNRDDDDVVSNPSEEGHPTYLNIDHYSPSSGPSSHGRPLPPVPHSRGASGNYPYYDPMLAHSRHVSEQVPYPASPGAALSLNPNAKPFVYGQARSSGSFTPGSFGEASSSSLAAFSSSVGHSRGASLAKPLNVTAPTFTPSRINPAAPVFTPGGFNPSAPAFTPVGLKPTAPAFTPSGFNIDAPTFTPGGFNLDAPPFTPGGFNANAPAFAPSGFTFKPPSGAPQLSIPSPQSARPLPTPPQTVNPVRAEQGREKRQRRNSETNVGEDDENTQVNDSMTSFKFPSPEKATHVARRSGSEPTSPAAGHSRQASSLNAGAKPFTFSSFTPTWPSAQRDGPVSEPTDAHTIASPLDQNVVNLNSDEEPMTDELPIPPQYKPKRAPIPLDFTHPVSTKTVPAGLFKALNNNADDSPRRGLRSRIGSKERFEHSQRPSLDDLNVVPISFTRKPARMVTDPGLLQAADGTDRTLARLRAASMPGATGHSPASSVSDISVPPMQLGDRITTRSFEQRLEELLEVKIGSLREDLLEQQSYTFGGPRPAAPTEAAIAEVVSSLHAQLQESVSRALEDSRLDAHGELDFELIRDIVEQGHSAARSALKGDLAEIVARLNVQQVQPSTAPNVALEDLSSRTILAVTQSTSVLTERLNRLEGSRTSAKDDREMLAAEVVASLMPHFSALRSEPVDYDGLTNQLSQAVKPHIAQLIDLASDKRETAELIVQHLMPVLSTFAHPPLPLDTNALAAQLTAEVRRVVAPIDAHAIKEQVSDLVVERLDSRLAVRDRAFNVETVVARVTESMGAMLEPVRAVAAAVEKVSAEQQTLGADTRGLVSSSARMSTVLDDLPNQLAAATEALKSTEAELRAKATQGEGAAQTVKAISEVTSAVSNMQGGQRTLSDQVSELVALQQDVISGLNALPEVLVATTKVLDGAHDDMMTRERSYQRDLDEVRKILATNAELQTSLAKARSQHGQVRVEKDLLNERLMAAEAERDRLRAQMEDMHSSVSSKSSALAAAESKNAELERIVATTLERLQVSDAASQSQQDRLAQFEVDRKTWLAERDQLKSTVKELELRSELALRSKESAEQATALMRAENQRLTSNDSHWEALRRASEQIETLSSLVSQADDEEIKELRRARDKSHVLEGEFAALQKRFKDQEGRMASTERTAYTARQTLAQAQQRAAEWEKKAKDYEAELRTARARAEESESARAQLDVDFSDVQTRLEEKDAHDRLARDRESKLRDQVAALEGQLAKAQVAMSVQSASSRPTLAPSLNGNGIVRNGQSSTTPARRGRAASPASTVFANSRSTTPVRFTDVSPLEGSVRDSMHAPKPYPTNLSITTGGARPPAFRAPASYRAPSHRAASPAPSMVSVAPTLGNDGWWE